MVSSDWLGGSTEEITLTSRDAVNGVLKKIVFFKCCTCKWDVTILEHAKGDGTDRCDRPRPTRPLDGRTDKSNL